MTDEKPRNDEVVDMDEEVKQKLEEPDEEPESSKENDTAPKKEDETKQ